MTDITYAGIEGKGKDCPCDAMTCLWEPFKVYLTLNKSIRTTTIRRYQTNFKDAARYFSKVEDFTPKNTEQYLYKKKQALSASTYTNYLVTLRHFADFLVHKDLLANNFIRTDFKAPKKDKRLNIQPLSVEEIEAIISAPIVYKRNQFMVIEGLRETYDLLHEMLATTGARLSEVLNLQVKDLDFALETITLYKTKTQFRVIPMPNQLIQRLEEYTSTFAQDSLVFKNSNGKKFAKNKVLKDIKRRAELVGIKKRVYLHLYRHSFATIMLSNGSNLSFVKEILGHERIETTDKYTHLLTKQHAEAMKRYHPIIRKSLNPLEKIDDLENSARTHIVFSDPTLDTEIKRGRDYLYIKVSW